ncbi:MAG: DMT family transporter [Bacillota bacterium]
MDQKAVLMLQQRELSYAKKGIGLALLTGALWGLDGVLLGMVLGQAPFISSANILAVPLVAACLHDGFAAIFIFIKNFISGKWREYGRTLRTRPAKIIIMAAIMGGPIGMSGNLLGIYFAGASYTAAITAAYPAIGAVLSAIFLKEKISARVGMGISLAILGAFFVGYAPPSGDSFPHFYLGICLAIVAAVGWAIEGVMSTYGMDLVDSDIAIGIRQATSFIVFLFFIIPLIGKEAFQLVFQTISSPAGLYIAVIGLIAGVSYLCFYRALNMTGVTRAMGLNVTYALWAVLFGWLLNGLQITSTLFIGVILISLGTILTIGNPKKLEKLREN